MKNIDLNRLENIDIMEFSSIGLLKISRVAREVHQRSGKRVVLSSRRALPSLVNKVLQLDDARLNKELSALLYEQALYCGGQLENPRFQDTAKVV